MDDLLRVYVPGELYRKVRDAAELSLLKTGATANGHSGSSVENILKTAAVIHNSVTVLNITELYTVNT